MNTKHFLTIFLIGMVIMGSAKAQAEERKFYWGLHGGKILLNDDAKRDLNEDHYSGGFVIGADLLDFKQSTLAMEADFSFPLSSGSSKYFGSWKLYTAGLFCTMRTGQQAVYLKLKLGIVYENLNVDYPGSEGANDLGISPGIGIGFRPKERTFIELEINIIDQDMGYLRGMLGYHF